MVQHFSPKRYAPMFSVLIAIILGIVVFFCWATHRTKKRHAAFTKADVILAIENVLSGETHDEWDLFLTWAIRDSYLESIRQKCIAISREHSGNETGKDLGTPGEEKLRMILGELKGA